MNRPAPTEGLEYAWSRVLPIGIAAALLCSALLFGGWKAGRVVLQYVDDVRREWAQQDDERRKHEEALAALTKEAEAAKTRLREEERRRLAAEREAQQARAAAEARASELGQINDNRDATNSVDAQQADATRELQAQKNVDIEAARVPQDEGHVSTVPAPVVVENRQAARTSNESILSAPAAESVHLLQTLALDAKRRWSAAEALIVSGVDMGYVEAADELRKLLADIGAFERANGTVSETNELRGTTVQKLEEVMTACNAENQGNRRRRSKEVPCPTRR